MTQFTHIVVGAGSAGCVVAARLSEETQNRVLLLEAGGRDWNPMFHIPLGSGKLLRRGLYGWKYETEPEEATGNRRIRWPRGRVLGGCSTINGLVYVRGLPSDYDGWAALGNKGWSFDEVLPYFKRSENHLDRADPFHAQGGPLGVSRGRSPNPIYEAFVGAGREAGYPVSDDFNGGEPDGFGRYDFNIVRGRRSSAAVAFLRPARRRPNLHVETDARVSRILFEGTRAVGIEYSRGGALRTAAATEIVLCAGVINTPALLMHSGIGDPEHLRELGISVLHALPGVGRNLQDHIVPALRFRCPQPVTLHSLIRFDRAAFFMAQAALLRTGPATSFPTEAGAFTYSRPGLPAPDLQWNCIIGLGASRLRIPYLYPWRPTILEQDGFTIGTLLLRPRSRGQVQLRSAEARDPPLLRPGYLTDEADLEALCQGVRQVREVARQRSLARFISDELIPGREVTTEDEIRSWIRGAVESAHHQVGTCKMGSDRMAVVDASLRVHGLDGLRIADASIMPTQISGNTNAPSIMIGEKASDLIRGRPALPAERFFLERHLNRRDNHDVQQHVHAH